MTPIRDCMLKRNSQTHALKATVLTKYFVVFSMQAGLWLVKADGSAYKVVVGLTVWWSYLMGRRCGQVERSAAPMECEGSFPQAAAETSSVRTEAYHRQV